MGLIDIHCHLDLKQFEKDLDDVMRRAEKAGVSIIVQNALNPESVRKSIGISERFDSVRLALGLYPVDALKLSDEQIDSEIDFIKKRMQADEKVIAIGEVGIDYHWIKDKKEQARQRAIFQKFINLSERTGKPLIIHSRESEKDAFDMLVSSDAKAVFHCFNGDLGLAKKAEDEGYCFSMPASITFIKRFQEIAGQTAIRQLFAETDAPYMSPFRGERKDTAKHGLAGLKMQGIFSNPDSQARLGLSSVTSFHSSRNEPSFVAESYKKIAEVKKMRIEDAAQEIEENYNRLFKKIK